MRMFIFGFLLGVSLCGGIVTAATDVKIIGTGYANGWDVVTDDGEVICSDPYVTRGEITCDD